MSILLPSLVLGAAIVVPTTTYYSVLYAAKNKRQLTQVPEGHIEFVMAGNKVLRVLTNIRGHHYDPTDGIIKPTTASTPHEYLGANIVSRWLREEWGTYYVSLFTTARSIHEFEIIREAVVPQSSITSESRIKDMVFQEDDGKPIKVRSLRWQFPRPVAVPGAEDKNNLETEILAEGLFQVMDPVKFVFLYKADFDRLTGVVRSAINDFVKARTFEELRNTETTKGSPAFFGEIDKALGNALEKEFGVRLIDLWVVSLKEDPDAQEALKALKKSNLTGRAKLREAAYNRRVDEQGAIGKAADLRERGKAYTALDPRVAQLVNSERVADAMSKLPGTFVQNGGATPVIPIGSH